jgi:hypothetical protein
MKFSGFQNLFNTAKKYPYLQRAAKFYSDNAPVGAIAGGMTGALVAADEISSSARKTPTIIHDAGFVLLCTAAGAGIGTTAAVTYPIWIPLGTLYIIFKD